MTREVRYLAHTYGSFPYTHHGGGFFGYIEPAKVDVAWKVRDARGKVVASGSEQGPDKAEAEVCRYLQKFSQN